MDGLSGGVIISLFMKSTKWLIFPERVTYMEVGCSGGLDYTHKSSDTRPLYLTTTYELGTQRRTFENIRQGSERLELQAEATREH